MLNDRPKSTERPAQISPACREGQAKILGAAHLVEGSGFGLLVANHVRRCAECRRFSGLPLPDMPR